jgi:hypothetical protein
MTKVATTLRCVPRYGYGYAEVRCVDLDVSSKHDEQALHAALERWFTEHGIDDAVYSIEADDDGYFAVINDEAYLLDWGSPIGL